MRRILVVDDQPAFGDLIESLFSGDYEVVSAADGEEGIEKASSLKPDLILLDVMMPRISGIEALRRLRRGAATMNIPVVVITANLSPAVKSSIEAEPNVRGFLNKIAGIEAIRSTIREILA